MALGQAGRESVVLHHCGDILWLTNGKEYDGLGVIWHLAQRTHETDSQL